MPFVATQVDAPLVTDPVVSAFVLRLRAEMEMKNQILQAHQLVEWLDMEDGPMGDGPMGKDSNNMWDWEGNHND